MEQTKAPLIEVKSLIKDFPGTRALDDVSVKIYPAEVHALVGENGAGKSTLIKIISGEYSYNIGEIFFEERSWSPKSPGEAVNSGIVRVPQEPSIVPDLTVAENIFLGHVPKRAGFVDYTRMFEEAEAMIAKLGIKIDVKQPAGELSVANQQMVLIASALIHDIKLVILDEPTASITEKEADILFTIVKKLKAEGISIIFISHRLEEIFKITDRITVLRDGKVVESLLTKDTCEEQLVNLMVGREIVYKRDWVSSKSEEVVLEVRNLCREGTFEDISFLLHKGEILALAGLMGSGRTEIARAIFGADKIDSGEILIEGRKVNINSPANAISYGIGFATEDRKEQGLFLKQPVRTNVTFIIDKVISSLGFWVQKRKEKDIVSKYIKELRIRTPNMETKVKSLSGGNQQKVVLARWLAKNQKILIVDEPTRGIDVGAKAEVHELMRQLAREGVAIIMISSELPEVLSMADNVIVMHEGRISGYVQRSEMAEELLVRYASGIVKK